MFTGIIQSQGSLINSSDGEFQIVTKLDLTNSKIGSSISCNGICLTITKIINKDGNFIFNVNIGEETLRRTNLNNLNNFKNINLETSLKISDEIGGHFVYGHIDCVTKILTIDKNTNSWDYVFEKKFNENNKFIIEKGSISINGISLTIANVKKESFSVSVIAHTFNNTNLKFSKENDLVNVEFDHLAKYILNK